MDTSMSLTENDMLLFTYLDLNMKRNEGSITDEELSKLKELAEKEDRAKELEDMYNKVMNKEKTSEDYYELYEKYKKELVEAVKKAKEAEEKPKEEALTISLTSDTPIEEAKKEENDITKELKIIEYLNLEAKRSEGALTPEEESKIIEYAASIDEVKNLEDAHTKYANGDINIYVLQDMREKYKSNVINKIKESGEDVEKYPISDGKIYEGMAMENENVTESLFTEDIQDLIDYFQIEVKREKEKLSAEEEKRLIHLKSFNPKAMALEETHKRLLNKKLPLRVLKVLRDKYKKEVTDAIQAKGLNPSDYLPSDDELYVKLAEYENTPVAEEYKNPTPAAEPTPVEPAPEIKEEIPAAPVEEVVEEIKDETPAEPVAEPVVTPEPVAAPEPTPVEPAPVETPAPQTDSALEELKAENQKLKAMILELQEKINGEDDSKLPENYRELKKYFKLDSKRNDGTITEEEKIALRELTKNSTNNMIEEIENTVRKKITGEYTEEEYNKAHEEAYNKYKAELDSEIEKAKTL